VQGETCKAANHGIIETDLLQVAAYNPRNVLRREEIMKVGYIGVGNMGGPMCRNLIKKSNHAVSVFDLNAAALKTCTDLGATAGKSIADVTKDADIVMTSLPMPKDVEAVTLGDNGILANITKGKTFIDLSTNAPSMVKKIGAAMAAKGIAMLDAPVSGGTTGAEAATIAIMVGGEKKVFDDALPVLQSFSANVIHMGPLGSGTVAKLVNNMLSFCNLAALCEGMMLGTTYGLNPEKLLSVIASSSGNSNAIRNFSQRALKGLYSPPSFALDLAYKDLHLALELGDELGVPLQQGASTHNLQRLAKGMGWGPEDSSSILRVYETMLRRKVKP
jgi:3-hydroxyisobutyrate dehydrogenase-like beta-hydroxyacid dehydrogenase